MAGEFIEPAPGEPVAGAIFILAAILSWSAALDMSAPVVPVVAEVLVAAPVAASVPELMDAR